MSNERTRTMLKRGNQVLSPYGLGAVGWVNEDEVRVVLPYGEVKVVDRSEVDRLDYFLDRDFSDSFEVWAALNFIHGLRQRGDKPGSEMASLLEPLAEAYRATKGA